MSQKPSSFRPRDAQQRADFDLLCFVLGLDASKTIRLGVDTLIEANREKMDEVRELYEAAQGALEQARASLGGHDEN